MSEFERNVREQLRHREGKLTSHHVQRLRVAREQALRHGEGTRLPAFLLPLGGMTLASFAALFLLFSPFTSTTAPRQDVLMQETADMQDLDFYYWLAQTEKVNET